MKSSTEVLDGLFETIEARKSASADSSYTASLYAKGRQKITQKVGEEGVELALAGALDNREEIVSESADLIYHMFVLWADAGIKPAEVYQKLAEREGLSGLDEKASRSEKG
ncbi:phosphoribosyl-ATP diphosphatase [Sneathiella limimaris]|uniref:phosphoribosyl-ATP diphosphatase n=1 Tax=Sneathiella limimaris TaxID=1964213 RepID=UPI0019D233BB|nr:phosphoribosyl-ATP diphosphatase [Sneathiella limimaris]